MATGLASTLWILLHVLDPIATAQSPFS